MTKEEYKNISFSFGMKIETFCGEIIPLVSADFEESKFGIRHPSKPDEIKWIRCEDVKRTLFNDKRDCKVFSECEVNDKGCSPRCPQNKGW